MGRLCDFCGEQRSMVYCRSDAACLCLSCDRTVHSANALSRRHSRTLVCERCNSQPAAVRCMEEEISLCQNCNLSSHAAPASAAGHKQQSINCYSGCPSAAELSSIWSFFSAGYSSCSPEIGSMSLEKEDQRISYCSLSPIDYSITEAAVDHMASGVDKFRGKRSLNSLSEKVKFLCIYATRGCCCWLTWRMPGRFNKRIRYDSCKVMADVRKRVKGRFVKVGDPYDYDPLYKL